MKILICGLGSIGKRHARLIKQSFSEYELYALRTYQGQERNDLGITELKSWEEVEQHDFEVAFITNPTFLHIQTATECAKRKMHLFLEKPVDCKVDGLDELLSLIEEHRLTAYVAYPLRHLPVLKKLKELLAKEEVLHSRSQCSSYLPNWRPGQDHLKNCSALREQGGGVLLDLSHDIDVLQFLFGEMKEITGKFEKKSDVTIDSEDFADLIVTHAQGTSSVHLNYFSHEIQRFIEIDTKNFFIRADLVQNSLQYQAKDKTKKWKKVFAADPDEMYRTQLHYFFDHLYDHKIDNNLFDAGRFFRKLITLREMA